MGLLKVFAGLQEGLCFFVCLWVYIAAGQLEEVRHMHTRKEVAGSSVYSAFYGISYMSIGACSQGSHLGAMLLRDKLPLEDILT